MPGWLWTHFVPSYGLVGIPVDYLATVRGLVASVRDFGRVEAFSHSKNAKVRRRLPVLTSMVAKSRDAGNSVVVHTETMQAATSPALEEERLAAVVGGHLWEGQSVREGDKASVAAVDFADFPVVVVAYCLELLGIAAS